MANQSSHYLFPYKCKLRHRLNGFHGFFSSFGMAAELIAQDESKGLDGLRGY